MPKREPASPPVIPGYEFTRLLGSGGYSEVFLYEQQSPRREVAIKVLAGEGAVPGLTALEEASLMARVSAHPFMVQVFGADIAPDGRPYIVMEYYSGATFSARAKSGPLQVPEVLRTGIRLASAVEDAHRAGILHRDIKPANILTNRFGHPGLTDFGIAAPQGLGHATEAISLPWAPPEALGDVRVGVAGDIYSLAATLYTLLAGHAPFEIPSGDNGEAAMIQRTLAQPVPQIRRNEIPVSLQRTLANAMAKDPALRPESALAFARELQRIEVELQLAETPIDLATDAAEGITPHTDDESDVTVVGRVVTISPEGPGLIDGVGESTDPTPFRHGSPLPVPEPPPIADTVLKAKEDVEAPAPVPVAPAVQGKPITRVVVAGVLLGLVAFAGFSYVRSGADDEGNVGDAEQVNDNLSTPVAVSPPAVGAIETTDNGDQTFTFTWEAPTPNVEYAVLEVDGGSSERIIETSFVSASTCIEVEVIGSSGLISAPTRGCHQP